VHGQHRGIFWVEVGVAITVSGVMLKIFYMFADAHDANGESELAVLATSATSSPCS
jgi:hypothetical protein